MDNPTPQPSGASIPPESLAELKRDRDLAIQLYCQAEREKGEFKDMDFAALLARIDEFEEVKLEVLE